MTSRGLWRLICASAIGVVHICCLSQTATTGDGGAPAAPAAAASAAPKAPALPASAAGAAQAQDADKLISDVLGLIPAALKPYADLSLSTIKIILAKNAEGQTAVYEFARTINANISNVGGSLYNDVRVQTEKLIDASYSDNIRQNANLSNQLKTRLKGLIADSLLIQSGQLSAAVRKIREDEFLRELTLLTERYVYSKQFRVGVGLSYMYLPQMSYVAYPNIDLSPFQNQEFGGTGRALFLADFSNRSSLAINLSAKVPYTQVDFLFPAEEQKLKMTTPAQRFAVSTTATTPDILARTTIDSTANVEFDAALSVSLGDVYRGIGKIRAVKDTPLGFGYQWDAGVGYGLTGFRVRENASTEVRVRNDPTKTFNELQTSGTTTSARTFSVHAPYWRAHFSMWISDELQVGMVARRYRRATVDTGPVNIKGSAISVFVSWYPTFPW